MAFSHKSIVVRSRKIYLSRYLEWLNAFRGTLTELFFLMITNIKNVYLGVFDSYITKHVAVFIIPSFLSFLQC